MFTQLDCFGASGRRNAKLAGDFNPFGNGVGGTNCCKCALVDELKFSV